MRLCWTTILYNEEKRIARTIQSLAPIIDGAVIGIDNKTDDNTEEEVKKWLGHFNKDISIYNFEFKENYSIPRNTGIALAESLNYDYVIIIDGDEYIDEKSIEWIKKIIVDDPDKPDFDSILSTQIGHHNNKSYQQSAPSIRIFKSCFRYIYRIHETPNISSSKNVRIPEIIIHNDKEYEDRQEKITKYRIENILLDIGDFPDVPELKFNLALEYLSISQYEQGIKYLQESLENHLPISMQLMAHIRLSKAFHMLNRVDEEYVVLTRMINKFPHHNEHLIHLGIHHLMKNEPFEAANYLFTAANIQKPSTYEMKYDHYYTWVPWFLIYKFTELIKWEEGKEKVKKIFNENFPEQLHKLERTINGKEEIL